MRTRASLALLVLALLPACDIYFGGDDGDDDCYYDDGLADYGLRNPETGTCELFGGGGGGGCGVPVADQEAGAPYEAPDWGACPSECEALSESACWAADRCHAAYLTSLCPPDTGCDQLPSTFLGCWSIAPSGPAYERVACESLDAYECSRHNDCVANYTQDGTWDALVPQPTQRFLSCAAEPVLGCYGDADCPSGWDCTSDTECLPPPGCDPSTGMECPPVCYGRCEPPASACAAIDCAPGYHCEETCFPCDSTDGEVCPPFCTAECVPDTNVCPIECPPGTQCVGSCPGCEGPGDPSCDAPCGWECVPGGPQSCADVTCAPGEICELACTINPDGTMGECRPVCVPDGGSSCTAVDCGPGFHCEEQCALPPTCVPGEMCPGETCAPVCVPNNDPGLCEGDVLCDSLPPTCPAGTTAGIRNGCWTGYCIPLTECGTPPPPSCEAITDEMTCIASAPTCRPLYTGTCWIDPAGQWQCTNTQFTRCETSGPTPAVPPQP